MAVDRRASGSISTHFPRWRRFLPWLVFLFVIIFIQFYTFSLRNSHFIKHTFGALTSYTHRKNVKTGPLHVLIVSYARTGSSFLGDLLQSLPGTFYHFEPLHFVSGPVLNDSFQEARSLLDKLLHCNVSKIDGFLRWQKKHKNFMKLKRNIRYWNDCSKKHRCYNGTYIDAYCRKHNTVIVKTIRLSLREASKLFNTHPNLNLKIVYLSRDPRGTLNSRMKWPVNVWCKKDPACFDSGHFCSMLTDDLEFACSLSSERPDDFSVVRYEDLSIDPFGVARRLVKFLHLSSMPKEMDQFLKTHTSFIGNVKEKSEKMGLAYSYSTFRNSSITALSWRKEIPFDLLLKFQDQCRPVLATLGYYSYATLATLRSNMHFDVDLEEALRSACTKKIISNKTQK